MVKAAYTHLIIKPQVLPVLVQLVDLELEPESLSFLYGTLYGVGNNRDRLFTLNLSTGIATERGQITAAHQRISGMTVLSNTELVD